MSSFQIVHQEIPLSIRVTSSDHFLQKLQQNKEDVKKGIAKPIDLSGIWNVVEHVKNNSVFFKTTAPSLRHEYNLSRATIVFSYYKETITLITVWPGNRKKV